MSTFRRLLLDTPGVFSSLRIVETPFPELTPNEVLVKMEYSTVNPSDYYLALGAYPNTPRPIPLGLEGSGTVTHAGTSEEAQSLLGTRVAVRGSGSWSEYHKVNSDMVFPLLDTTQFDQASNLIVNPMTVAYFIELIQTSNHKVVIQNAAASSLGKMLVRWAKLNNVELINLVRREEQVQALIETGATLIVNTSGQDWKGDLKRITDTYGLPSIGFDAIGGKETGELIEAVGPAGFVYTYGRLSGEDAKISCTQMMFYNKTWKGLFLSNWLAGKNSQERKEVGFMVQRNLESVFGTRHSKVINLNEIQQFLEGYKNEPATNNKVLVRTRFE
jgi:NADPH:quinone reductase-like Zn-dependent oxidoreductase